MGRSYIEYINLRLYIVIQSSVFSMLQMCEIAVESRLSGILEENSKTIVISKVAIIIVFWYIFFISTSNIAIMRMVAYYYS